MDGLFRGTLRRGAIGFALGLPVSAGIFCLTHSGAFPGDMAPLVLSMLSGALFGAVVMAATVVYEIDRWSLTRATLTHLLVALGGMYLLGLVQGWLALTLTGFVAPTLCFVTVYAVIWLIQGLSLRDKIRRMNRGLAGWKAAVGETPPDPHLNTQSKEEFP